VLVIVPTSGLTLVIFLTFMFQFVNKLHAEWQRWQYLASIFSNLEKSVR
jgi:hypothetical protein